MAVSKGTEAKKTFKNALVSTIFYHSDEVESEPIVYTGCKEYDPKCLECKIQVGSLSSHNLIKNLIRLKCVQTEGKGKVVAASWGNRIESRTSHLSARMIWRKVFKKHPFCVGGGLVWCEWIGWSFILPPNISSSIHPFLQIILWIIGCAAFNSVLPPPPQTSSDDPSLPFCLILILWLYSAQYNLINQ